MRSLIRLELSRANNGHVIEIAQLPDQIRGYGHFKEANVETTKAEWDRLLAEWRNPNALAARVAT